jgi:probable rRNA maturation factor
MFTVDIQNQSGFAINARRLQAAAAMVLSQREAPADACLSIVITDDEAVADLNRRFRGVDTPTDVLSFPADALPPALADEPPYLGDIIIAYPYATAQAAREGHNLNDSLGLLVVHGVLHLLGYDHDTPEGRSAMWQAQGEALAALAIAPGLVPTLEGEADGQADDETG